MYETAIAIVKMTVAPSWYGNSGIVVPLHDDWVVLVVLHGTPAALAQVQSRMRSSASIRAPSGDRSTQSTVVGLQLMPAGQVVVVVVVWQGARAGSHVVVVVVVGHGPPAGLQGVVMEMDVYCKGLGDFSALIIYHSSFR